MASETRKVALAHADRDRWMGFDSNHSHPRHHSPEMWQWVNLENCANPLERSRPGDKHDVVDLDVNRPPAPVFVEHNEVMVDRKSSESRPQPRERRASHSVSLRGRETAKRTLKVTDERCISDPEVLSDREDVLWPGARKGQAPTREG